MPNENSRVPAEHEEVIRGYRVKVRFRTLSPEETEHRRWAIAQILCRAAIRRLQIARNVGRQA